MRCTGFRHQTRGHALSRCPNNDPVFDRPTPDEDVWPEAKMQSHVNWIPRPEWLHSEQGKQRSMRPLTEEQRALIESIRESGIALLSSGSWTTVPAPMR